MILVYIVIVVNSNMSFNDICLLNNTKTSHNSTNDCFIDFNHVWEKGTNVGFLWTPSVIHGWSADSMNEQTYAQYCQKIDQNVAERECIQKISNKNGIWSDIQISIINFFENFNLISNNNFFRLTRGFQELIDYETEFLEIEQLLQECKYIYDH